MLQEQSNLFSSLLFSERWRRSGRGNNAELTGIGKDLLDEKVCFLVQIQKVKNLLSLSRSGCVHSSYSKSGPLSFQAEDKKTRANIMMC